MNVPCSLKLTIEHTRCGKWHSELNVYGVYYSLTFEYTIPRRPGNVLSLALVTPHIFERGFMGMQYICLVLKCSCCQ